MPVNQSYQGKLSMFPYDPRFRAIAPPSSGIFDEPTMSICFNIEWAGHIDGVLSRLLWTDAWAGTPQTQQWAVGEITKLLVSMIARNPCGSGCMGECCDDIIERLEAIEALLAAGPRPSVADVKASVGAVQSAYQSFVENIESTWQDDITNVYPELAYGDANDPIRDQALCFICRRFVDLCCDWVLQNIKWKTDIQQTVLNIAELIGEVSEAAGRFFGETAFGRMFNNIDRMIDLGVPGLTLWIQTVTASESAAFQDQDARAELACAWYEGLKGQEPSLSLFIGMLYAASVTGNASTIRAKLGAALTPVSEPQEPSGERLFFIWADLWAEAYQGVQDGIVPECLCEEPPEPRVPVINSIWDAVNGAGGVITGPDADGFYLCTATNAYGDGNQMHIMDEQGRPFILTNVSFDPMSFCQVFLLNGEMLYIGCDGSNHYTGQAITEWVATWESGTFGVMQFKMVAP